MKQIFFFFIPVFISVLFYACTKDPIPETKEPEEETEQEPPEEVVVRKDVTNLGVMTVNLDNNGGSSSTEGSLKLIDNDTTSKFLVHDIKNGLMVQFRFNEPTQVAAYQITSGNDADGRDPLNWIFSGSNDGQSWVQLDKQDYEMFSKRRLTNRYTFRNKEKFTYYRWHITKLYGGGQMFQASEFRMFTIPPAEQTVSPFSRTDTIVRDDLTLYFVNKSSNFPNLLKQNMINVFFTVYPRLRTDFNPQAQKVVAFRVEPRYTGVAYVFGGFATYSSAYMLKNTNDLDVVTHEVMHIIQSYPGGVPSWVTEGIADYVRYKYGLYNGAAGWSLPNYNSSQKYTDAYRVTARFLAWMEKNNPGFVQKLDGISRQGKYTSNFWLTETGKTVDELWALYAQDPRIN